MKKLLLLAVVLLWTMLAGCLGTPAENETADTTTPPTEEETVVPADDTKTDDTEAAEAPAEKTDKTAPEAAPEEDLTGALTQLFVEKYDKETSEVTLTLGTQTENHVRGTVKFGEGGPGEVGGFLAAKVDEKWELVFDGNGEISCTTVEPYNFPADMIKDCADF